MNYRNLPDVAVVQAGVTATGPSSIASLAAQHGGGRQVDILSIDVDGLDFNLLESLHAAPEVTHTAYIHTYIHTYMHACIHTHTHAHTVRLTSVLASSTGDSWTLQVRAMSPPAEGRVDSVVAIYFMTFILVVGK